MARMRLPERAADIAVRLLYVGASIAMLWVVERAADDLRDHLNQHGFSSVRLAIVNLLLVFVGILFGLALRPAATVRGYRWGVALSLGAVPGVFVVYQWLFFQQVIVGPDWVWDLALSYGSLFPVMVGVALTAGLTARRA